ncbi:MAG: RagB/SusD family nutrient uptake outer membrane protein, partial [Chitinophagaceae bacterium]
IWNGHYQGIARANRAIDVLGRATFDQAVKNRYIGEVRYLRALYYFDLVRMFGGVPLVLRVPPVSDLGSDEFNVRKSRDSVYAAIVADLQFAADNLPLKGEAGTQPGRANKGAAQALLSKVYLYQQNWQGALDMSRAVIESGKYSLVTDYFSIFREAGNNNSESIFEVQTSSANCGLVSELYSNSQGPRAKMGWNDIGFGFNVPTSDLVGAYEAGDTRKNASIIFITPTVAGNSPGTVLFDGFRIPSQDSVENPRYNYKVYHSNTAESPSCAGVGDKDKKPQNIRIMRYAEVLLIYAEAAARLGLADGGDKLNQVRARANLAPVAGTLDNVLKERRVELALEGDRFFDLVRTGRAGTVLRAHGKAFVDNKNEVFPIPQPQIDLSGGRLTQNPGY